ncbi:MAG: RcnB family protein [Alphaproteobacteria bacterium]
MKKTMLLLAAAAMVASSTLAQAQTRGGRDDGRDSRSDSRNYNQGGRDGHSYSNQYRAGQRLDSRYRTNDREIRNWSSYRLSAPPRGYTYYRDDNGNAVLAAITTGIIAFALADIFNNNNNSQRYDNGGYGYSDPYAGGGYRDPRYDTYNAPYSGGYSNGRAPIWYDRYGRPYTVDQYGRSVWVN